MEKQFSARFDIVSYESISSNIGKVIGNVFDNTGNFFATSVNVGDIIYVDGSMLGLQVLRYKVKSINSTKGTELCAIIIWDMGSDDPIELFSGLTGIIGKSTKNLKIAALPSISINMLDESFINSIKNYESTTILDSLIKSESPEFTGKPLVPTANLDSNDNQIANTEWVNNKVDSIDNVENYIALEDILKFKLVCISDNNTVELADSNNVNHSDKIIGISLEQKLQGEQIAIMLKGELHNNEWSFVNSGQLLFAGQNGDMITNPSNNTGFIQQVGITSNTNSMMIDIEEAIILS